MNGIDNIIIIIVLLYYFIVIIIKMEYIYNPL